MKKIIFAVIILLITVGGITMYQKIGWENKPSTKTALSAENFEHMDEGIYQAHSQLADIVNNSSTGLVAAGTGLSPETINYKLRSIIRDGHMTIPVYNNKFESNPNDNYLNELTDYKTHADIKWVWSQGKLNFTYNTNASLIGVTHEILTKTPVAFETASFTCEVDVLEDYEFNGVPGSDAGTSIRVGVIKDDNNYIVANYDKAGKLVQIIGNTAGTFFVKGFAYTSYAAPYRLMLMINNNIATVIIEKDGIKNFVGEWWFGANLNLNNPTVLKDYCLGFGARIVYGNRPLSINGLYGNYSSGMSMGADFKAITYEDGCPIKNGNSIYVCSTIHSTHSIGGASGLSIYKLDLNSYKIEYVGQISGRKAVGGSNFGGGAGKIFYDRNKKYWVVQMTDFNSTAHTYICTTKTNLLSGIHVLTMQEMDVPQKNVATWDFDIIFDKTDGLYHCVYSRGSSGDMTHITASDVLGTWTEVLFATAPGEGNTFFKANGKYYISRTDASDRGLTIWNYPELTYLGLTSVNTWCAKVGASPHSWGQIIALNNGDKTNFYMIVFSARKWADRTFAYGDMWIYKGEESETGLEFEERNVLIF